MSETEQNKPVETSEYSGLKWLFWSYRAIASVLGFVLLFQVIRFVRVAFSEYELPIVVLAEAHPLPEKTNLPFVNESGIRMIALDAGASLVASIEQDEAHLAPARYLGWSLYNLDVDQQTWQLLSDSRRDRLSLHALQDPSMIASDWYLLECSVRPGIFSGDQRVSLDKVTRALEKKPELAQSVVYLMWSPEKKASSKPKNSAAAAPPKVQAPEDAPELSPAEPTQPETEPVQEETPDETTDETVVENAAPDVDLRSSITGTDIEQTETLMAEAGGVQSAANTVPEKRKVAVPPRKGQESAEIPALADFEGNLPEMDIKITWDVREANLVSLLEKYAMAFYARTENAYRSLDGDWTCFDFKAQKTLTQKEFWDQDKESALKNYGNIGPGYGDLPDDLKKALDAALPGAFGGEVSEGILLLGSAILVANDAVSSFAKSSGREATQGAYEVQLVFTKSGEVLAESVKEREQP